MTANEIRQKFLDFFKGKGHTIVASDSVVPKDDPTVLFTTAGMQQFKRQFLGHIDGYRRAATSQKCLRTDDLDKVGKTPVHHTFFEMLGNFSFGDYFKKDAITWAWEFFTKVMGIAPDKLWVSVYHEDPEAEGIWRETVGLPPERILKLGDKDNFWPADAKKNGPNGPCGPCSEIFFDFGFNPNCAKGDKCDPTCNCGRFAEVWNLVFTQFNRKEGGILEPLPAKNIDTGMGLERLVAVMQGKKNNFETDLFEPIIKEIKKLIPSIGVTESRVIADHIRAITFGIADGVVPSNEGRGYVIKRLIIDAADLMLGKSAQEPMLYKLVPTVIHCMLEQYPELTKEAERISTLIKKIEEAFIGVRQTRIPELQETLSEMRGAKTPAKEMGDVVFKFRDTFGLTLETIWRTAISAGIDESTWKRILEYYQEQMEQQKERSRASSKMTGDVFADAELDLNVPRTEFLGYDEKNYHATGKILKLFVDDRETSEVKPGDEIKVVLDRTPFYAESGGQVGDTGIIADTGRRIKITDTQKIADVFIHSGKVEEGIFRVTEEVLAQIDTKRRLDIMRNHTATHLLQAALRRVLGTHVQQQGSLVAPDRLRFDFTHHQAVSKEEIEKIEKIINDQVMACDPVEKKTMDLKEAKESGAMAFFAEKYKDVVRVISVGDYSRELCGGTHLKSTGEIGYFKITSEGAVAQGIRRIEAKTGSVAEEFVREREKQDAERIATQNKRLQDQDEKKKTDRQFLESVKSSMDTIIKDADTVRDTKIVTYSFINSDAAQLKQVSDLIKLQIKSVAVCIGSTYQDSTSVIIGISDDLVKRGIKANELIKDIAPLIGGSGGGRPDLAQAGSKSPAQLSSVIQEARKILKKALSQ